MCGDSKQTEFSLKKIKLFLNNILQFESIIFERKRYFRKAIKDSFSEIQNMVSFGVRKVRVKTTNIIIFIYENVL